MDLLGILRIKDSNGNWVSVPGLKGETGEPFKILGIYATAADLEAAVTDPGVGDVYLVGTTGSYDIYLYLADGWHNTGRYMPKGDQGDPAPQSAITSAVETWLAANVDPETGYVIDTSLSVSGAAADAKKTGDLINGIGNELDSIAALNENAILNYSIAVNGRYLIWDTGEVGTEALQNYCVTDYVSVAGCKEISYKRTKHTIANPAVGMAFYDNEKRYISGVQGLNRQASGGYADDLYTVDVPDNAKFARFSALTDEQTYGPFEVYGNLTFVKDIDTLKNSVLETITGWIIGKSIATSGGIGSTVSLTPQTDASGAVCIVDCAEGDIFTINGVSGVGYRLWCFIDSDNKIIDVAGLRAKANNQVLVAPEGSSKLILQQNINAEILSPEACYFGVNPRSEAFFNAPENKIRKINAIWEIGGIDGSGLVFWADNIRTRRSIGFRKGEKLVVTNNSDDLMFAVYSTEASTNRILTNGWISNRGRIIIEDWNHTYMVRVRRVVSESYTDEMISEDSAKIDIEIVNDSIPYVSAYDQRDKANLGFERSYSYLNPFLTYERKDLQNDGTFVSSTTRCVAELPSTGCIEVKQQRYFGCFKIARVRNGNVTWLVDDWSYYSYRYIGDGQSKYYLIVANSENPDSTIYTDAAEHNVAVYSFTDEGVSEAQFHALNGKKIAFIGDSITQARFAKYGTSLNWTASKPFGALVAESIGDENYGNFGIGGALVYNNDWKSLFINCDKVTGYDVVFVCGGTNDYGNDVPRDDFIAAYTHVIETLMSNNTEVVVCTPVFRTSRTGANSVGLYLFDYVQIEQDIAEEKGLKVIDQYKLTNNNKFINYCPDGLHPNERGHRIMANNILSEYDRLSFT